MKHTFNARRSVVETTVFSYNEFLQGLIDERLADNPSASDSSMSDKQVAWMAEVSERQVRTARLSDEMTPYLADQMCIKALGLHPILVFGWEGWITPESFHADDLKRKKVTLKAIAKKTTDSCMEEVWEEMAVA
jgi:hypothetical protein